MKRETFSLIFLTSLLVCFLLISSAVHAQDSVPQAIVLNARGVLTPAMADYIERGLHLAASQKAELVIIQLDTPGGSIDLMNRIVEDIRASSVPVVVYVSPQGAMAGSAGTLITLAGHLAAMAPETAIGAASPVGSQGQDIGQTMESKVKEILKATVRSLTLNRPPAAIQLAEDTIQNARAASVDEALQVGLVDIKARDVADLLRQLDGKRVKINQSEEVLLTQNVQVDVVSQNFMEVLLGLLTNPNIVFLLLAVGVQAILIELTHPGTWVPGFIGTVCVLLAGYGLGVLPVNWFGGLFMVLAFVLFVLEIKTPTHGALAAAGASVFIIGALVLFNSVQVPGAQRLSVPLAIGTGVLLAAIFFTVMTFALRTRHLPVKTGVGMIVGKTGWVYQALQPAGQVKVNGEIWSAELADDEPGPLPPNSPIVVVAVEGLHLRVKKA